MGIASNLGSLAAVLGFAAGLFLGVNMAFPWPLNWTIGITFGIIISSVASAGFEIIDARLRYSPMAIGQRHTRDVYEDVVVEDCFSCSGADMEGVRVEWAKDDVVLGMVTDRHGGGISYYCSTCHNDAIEAGLRAGKEREFRNRYEGEDHYLDVLHDLRELYLEADPARDFWEYVEAAMDRVDEAEEEVSDPREYVDAVLEYRHADSKSEFWDRLAEKTGVDRWELRDRFQDRGWFAHIDAGEAFKPGPRDTETETESPDREQPESAGLPDSHY